MKDKFLPYYLGAFFAIGLIANLIFKWLPIGVNETILAIFVACVISIINDRFRRKRTSKNS